MFVVNSRNYSRGKRAGVGKIRYEHKGNAWRTTHVLHRRRYIPPAL